MSRPVGSKNIESFSLQHPSRCKHCDSTKRTKYENIRVTECETTLANGVGITHYADQQTRCGNCGSPRIDRTFWNLPKGDQPTIEPDNGTMEPFNFGREEEPAKRGRGRPRKTQIAS